MGKAPKSAFELAMERLRAQDEEAGLTEKPLTEETKLLLAEARRLYASRLAEREILFEDALRKGGDRERLEEELRTDRARIEADRERALERIRHGEA